MIRRGVLLGMMVASMAAARSPNVVVFLADDLGWADTSATGSSYYNTPHLERLAKQGTLFRSAYAANPLCSPTRASLLTGRYPGRLHLTTPNCHVGQVVLNPGMPKSAGPGQPVVTPSTCTRLDNRYTTFAEVFKEGGYATAFYGKWHLGSDPYLPDNQGFDKVVGGRRHPGPPGGFFAPWPCDTLPPSPPGTHITDALAEDAAAWIKAQGETPWLMCFWDYSVHAPFEAKQELIRKYALTADPANPQRNPIMAAMIEPLDDAVGRLLDTLEATGQSENTLFVFTSDNGGNMYDDVEGLSATSNHPLRGGKANSEEGGSRVPLIVAWPGKVPAGARSEALFTSPDLFPTLASACGLTVPEDTAIDGVDQWETWQGGDAARAEVYGHFPHYVPATGNRPSSYVRQGPWKLIRWYGEGEGTTAREVLYHLDDDPTELHDRAGSEPDRVVALGKLLDAHLTGIGAHVPVPNPAWEPGRSEWKAGGTCSMVITGGVMRVTSAGGDPFVYAGVDGPGWRPKRVRMRYRSTGDGALNLFWNTSSDKGFSAERRLTVPLVHDNTARTLEIEVPFKQVWREVRIDPGTGPGVVEIDDVQLLNPGGYVLQQWTFGE